MTLGSHHPNFSLRKKSLIKRNKRNTFIYFGFAKKGNGKRAKRLNGKGARMIDD